MTINTFLEKGMRFKLKELGFSYYYPTGYSKKSGYYRSSPFISIHHSNTKMDSIYLETDNLNLVISTDVKLNFKYLWLLGVI